jgi:phosphatidylglycerol lysyltransferase
LESATTAGAKADEARRRALALVLRYGWNATSFQTLGRGYDYFFHGDACVAYVDTGAAWIVAGAPISAPGQLAPTARAFVGAAQRAGRRCCFFGTERRFVLATSHATRSLPIGEQPVWNPRDWADTVAASSNLREQLRRARAKAVVVRQLGAAELASQPLRETMLRLTRRWLATRAMPPLGFLVRVDPSAFAEQRRCFVAERDGQLVALAHAVPVPQRGGWFVEHLLRDPVAPNGTIELLIDAVMRWARSDECSWLTLGMAPLSGDVPLPLRAARRGLSMFYDFEGLRRFRAKLRPLEWSPLYLSYPASQGPLAATADALAAFADGRFAHFAARAMRASFSGAPLCRSR